MYVIHDVAGGNERATVVRSAGTAPGREGGPCVPGSGRGQGARGVPEQARPGACSPTTWRRASSGPRRRASRGRNARDRVEKVFEIARRGGKALPVCVQTEEALGGRLPVCLVATAATRVMSDVLASRRTSPAVESMPGVPRERHATGRDGRLITTEPVRKTSEAHGAFGIRCPDTIRLPVVG